MKKIIYILTIFSVFGTVACKKIKPPVDESEANDPIYKIEGLMNGDSLKLYVDDSTVFIDNALYDFNGVEAYSSTISDAENDFELRVVVLRPEIYIDEEGVKLIENKDVDFLIDQEVCLGTSFGNSNQNGYFHINIDQQEFSGGNFATHGYGMYQAGLQFPNIDTKIYDITIPIGFNHSELIPTFNLVGYNNNLIEFEADNSSADFSHQWFVDDVLINTQASFTDTIDFGLHSVNHIITDQYGNIANHKTMFYINNNSLEWVMKFEENICNNDYYQSNNYGRGFIEVNRKGELFSSLYNPNNTAYKLKVTNIEYIIDGQSQSIKIIKFNLNFNAELKNKDESETILLENMQGVFQIKIN
jgi:hypothetical protein